MKIAQTRKGRVLHIIDEERPDPGSGGMADFYEEHGWFHYAICGEMVGQPMEGHTAPTCKDCIAKDNVLRRVDRVRIGADFNAKTNESEVTRIDFDVAGGYTYSIIVEYLGSRNMIVAELVDTSGDVPFPRERYGEWPAR